MLTGSSFYTEIGSKGNSARFGFHNLRTLLVGWLDSLALLYMNCYDSTCKFVHDCLLKACIRLCIFLLIRDLVIEESCFYDWINVEFETSHQTNKTSVKFWQRLGLLRGDW